MAFAYIDGALHSCRIDTDIAECNELTFIFSEEDGNFLLSAWLSSKWSMKATIASFPVPVFQVVQVSQSESNSVFSWLILFRAQGRLFRASEEALSGRIQNDLLRLFLDDLDETAPLFLMVLYDSYHHRHLLLFLFPLFFILC